jgi:hypothetical protein
MKNEVTKDTIQGLFGGASEQYNSLVTYRTSLEGTWRQCAELTLPYIFPEENISESTELQTPYNSIGPAGVNALASKLLLTLLPPTGNFFRLLPFEDVVKDMDEEELRGVDKDLSDLEQDILAEIDKKALRVPLFEALKYLIIVGNTLLYKVPNGSIKTFSPYNYVVQRDYVGNVLKIVIKESISITALPKSVQELLESDEATEIGDRDNDRDEADVYTVIIMTSKDKYAYYQEVNEKMVEGSYKTCSKEELPYIPLRWTASSQEYYGRGLVEQYLGDLRRIEGLSQLIVEGSSVQAKTIFGLRPGSQVKLEDLKNAYNGDVILGNLETDLTTWRVNKGMDFNIPMQVQKEVEARLARAFMMISGQVRDSERTTATEVRAVAAELEATLGGTYSVLATDLQIPLVTLVMKDLNKNAGKLVNPTIVTGTSAISREKDLNNLQTMIQVMAGLGEQTIREYLDVEGYMTSISTALGFDASVMVKSEDKRRAEAEQQAQMQAAAAGMEAPQGPPMPK